MLTQPIIDRSIDGHFRIRWPIGMIAPVAVTDYGLPVEHKAKDFTNDKTKIEYSYSDITGTELLDIHQSQLSWYSLLNKDLSDLIYSNQGTFRATIVRGSEIPSSEEKVIFQDWKYESPIVS